MTRKDFKHIIESCYIAKISKEDCKDLGFALQGLYTILDTDKWGDYVDEIYKSGAVYVKKI